MYDINRNALIIHPRKLLYEWVNYIYPAQDAFKLPPLLEHDEANVYLIPEFETMEECLEWVEENYEYFLEQELSEWSEDETQWPSDMSWVKFQEWFHISIQSVVIDCLDEPLVKE